MEMNGGTRDMDESGKGIKIITGGVTAAKGFKAASTAAGIKYKDRQDMAMIYSQEPCRSAGTFTTNVVKAAPVKWDKNQVTNGVPARAVVINAGIANACTGEEGMGYCGQTAGAAAQALGIPAESVLVASTGVIGMQLPMDRITAGVKAMAPLLDESLESGTGASRAIMTTDTKNKEVAVQFELGGNTVTMGGMCKGSGMIHPNMCTMLSFVTTDAAISKELLQEALSQDIRDTYNMISVDGDTSTNDTVLLLANGLAGNREITEKGEDYHTFCRALKIVNETLAKKMAGDGEGCTALFEVKIVGAETKEQARVLAKSVICSSLTKAAIFGHDANWGRILCAMGYSGARFDPERVDLYFESAAGKMQIIKDGVAVDYSEEQATRILSEPAVTAVADIKMGDAKATAWGCDLTFDYVRINADYRS
jgi:glutamate N-acetyltransferase/amino-acid N-acetyltransferase